MKKQATSKEDEATAEALRVLAGQVGAAAGQLVGLQMAVGALIESAANRDAIIASIWSAWQRIRANIGDTPSESHRLVLESVQNVLQQIGVKPPAS
jgi:hypothetical protein